ncbi:MAG TPA: response regulator transcription factor [Cyclobacteriaceae bacterium]|jgi:DNA-binding NarL/FixJ family response regulator|nr:response regulator transcription factor [Cyclobacteriaceae bacterium]
MKPAERIKVLLVDDHQLIRDGVQSMIENTDDLEMIGSVSSGEDSINQVRENRPDVILMDIMMGGMTGIEATRWIKGFDPTIKVVLLTMEISREYVSAGIKSGVDGYLPKDVDKETLLEALRTVHGGGRFFNDAIMKLVFEDFYSHEKLKSADKKLPDDLTKREYEVLGLVAAGKTNKELAETLFISTKTVETHKTHIMEKLGLRNSTELVKYAIKNKIISIDSL